MDAGGVIPMTAREARRVYVIEQVLARRIRQRPAAELLGCSVRQVKRLVHRVRAEGPRGLVHRLRGRPSNRRYPAALQQRVLALYQGRYADFGPTLACEHLYARHRLRVGRETLRRWLRTAGLWADRRRAVAHHPWRERKACVGELVQVDGSHHAWLEGRGPWLVLMAYIDDATNTVFARFYEAEGTTPALDSFARYARRVGLPQALYTDCHTTYRSPGTRTVADELAGRARPQSQFERALAELGVEVLHAHSPQAKGRVERLFGILQDRLVKALRLAGARTLPEANHVLARYLPAHNRRFRRVPRSAVNLHRPCPPAAVLRRALTIRTVHALRRDNTVQHAGQTYLLEARWAGARPPTITTERHLTGHLAFRAGEQILRAHPVATRPAPPPVPAPRRRGGARQPALDHPWRRWPLVRRTDTQAQRGTLLLSTKGDSSNGR